MRHLLALPLLLLAVFANAATYYLSPTGNDSNNGTSQSTPWRTIDRANQLSSSFQPGDRILFQRGGVYRGKLNIQNSGNASAFIEVGSYGTGAQPIISGSVAVTGWTIHSGNIWKAPVSQALKHVFVDGALQEIARFPNTGWLRVDQGTSTSLTDSELTQPNGYWNGATAVIRTTNWSYDTAFVSAFNNNTLTHTATGNNLGTWQWGYYLRNKLALLDAPGEWFHDRATGMLYLWCPNNANPNTVLVEASVMDFGVFVGWQRHHIKVDGVHFKHQTTASLRLSGSYDLEAMNCTFTDTWQAIYSTGSNQYFHHLDIQRTYGSAVVLLDNNSRFEDCNLLNIALVKGLGEQNMGYIAIRANGTGMVVRNNRVENVGYCGIAVSNDCLVERNLVINSMAILNDGAGITFDTADGAIIRDNVVRDLNGDVESSAIGWVHSVPICMGIYFGNVYNRNVLVKGNTVMNCKGSGMYVDHTMQFNNNRIEDNVLFNNEIQLFISDYSNYNGPGATAPFHVPSFNTVYANNVFYSLTKDQLLIQQYHVYSANWVDFGTWTGNRYFNPYNDRSIYLRNSVTGAHNYYTLERWRTVHNEDPSGSRSPLFLPSMEVTQVLAANTVPNSTFNSNVTGWTGWPSQGQITHNSANLDNGSLKLSFTSNATYNTHNLNHSATIGIQNGAWYRMKFSVVSDIMGEFTVGFKANSQANEPWRIGERVYAYDSNRRDVEHFFQSDRTDQGVCMFTASYTDGIYYLDNVSLERVTAVPVNPLDRQMILVNEQATAQTFSIPAGCWKDTDGNVMGATITLQPYKSRVIYRYAVGAACGQQVDCAGVPGGTAVPGTACNDNNACTINDTWNANCQCVGTPATPTASITPGGATSFCTGGSVVLNAATGTGYSYQWRNNGNNISGATASSYTATASGSYSVVITSGGCNATSAATTVTVSAAPAAAITAGGSTTFCNGGSVSFTANSGTGLTYQWRRNGINLSGATSSSYTATTNGSYTVVVTSGGCSNTSAATTVTVNASPTASITAGGATSFCTGGSVALMAAAGTGYTYQWRNNGANISGATASSYTATASGSYTVVVTASGCSSTSAAVAVSVSAAPSATITTGGSTTFCGGGSVTLTANSGSGLTYQWRQNGNNISGATASSYSATTSGSYSVVVSSGGCSTTSAATTVMVNATPTASITAGGATSFCTGGSVVLTAATGAGYIYQWRNNGTNISGATASSYTATASGSYTVIVTSSGCSSTSAATTVSVSAAPSATITAGGSTTFCNGGSVLLTTNSGLGLTYQWRRNGINLSGATGSNYTATTNGSYTVVVTSGGCSTTSSATSVTVNAAPVASITAGGATSFCTGGSVALTAATGAGYTYQWRRNATNLSGATSGSYTATTSGSYTVVVTASGCSSTSAATTVTVSAAPAATITAGGSTTLCSGGSVSLTANTGTGLTYQWRRNGAAISGATASSYSATIAGSYTVVVASGGCSTTSPATTVTVNAAPTASITAGGATSFCSGGNVVLSAATGTGYTYQWSRNGTNLSGATASSYTATTAGTYTVVVTSGGCSATSAATTVTVSAAPSATITAGGLTSFCAGSSVLLSANTGTGLTYQWRRDGAVITGATASSYSATLTGSYTVVVANGGCSATSAATSVSVKAAPVVNCSSSASTSSVSVTATGGQSPYTYAWNTSPAQNTPTATVTSSGTYTVTVTGANGCSATCSTTITVAGGSCAGIRTESQSTWGATTSSSLQAAYMAANFPSAFPAPNYLTIGCGQRLVRFTSAQGVIDALPLYGDFALLPIGTTLNPNGTLNNALLGNLTALKISIRLDEMNPSFSPADLLLKDMIVAQGTFAGWTVQQVVNLADQTLGGCISQYTFNTVNTIVRNINSGYQGGVMNSGLLACPNLSAFTFEEGDGLWSESDELRASAFPNPTLGATTISFSGLDPYAPLEVRIFDLSGALVNWIYRGEAPESGTLQLPWDASDRAAGMYFYEAINGERAVRGKLIVE